MFRQLPDDATVTVTLTMAQWRALTGEMASASDVAVMIEGCPRPIYNLRVWHQQSKGGYQVFGITHLDSRRAAAHAYPFDPVYETFDEAKAEAERLSTEHGIPFKGWTSRPQE